ncbi:MAG: ribosome assembly cofactor RimP [Bacteroidales bacterium]|jgi:ribosome maturation factor RimP|nr:ribosome assembly cofactor RimP [Bacteroidales bacterium]
MISKDTVQNIVLSHIQGTPVFLVDVRVDVSNGIRVEVDKPEGITIGECAGVSRAIEAALDREADDFAVEVSSPGLTAPFKVVEQYRKNCGKTVNVLTTDGQTFNGALYAVDQQGIVLEVKAKPKEEGQKPLRGEKQRLPLKFSEIKATKVSITFSHF